MPKKNKPDVVSLSPDEVEALNVRITQSSLAEKDKKIIIAVLSFNFWLQGQLDRAKLTILRLKKIFGLPTEKNPTTKSPQNDVTTDIATTSSPEPMADKDSTTEVAALNPPLKQKNKPQFDPTKNHGRYCANDYTGCPQVFISHAHLKVGDSCPDCKVGDIHGKLYASLPQQIVRLFGSPLITGTRYVIEKLRCTLCGQQYAADVPPGIAATQKYDETARSAIAIARYYSGLPFKRQEMLQAQQGVPLSDATQWDQMSTLYEQVSPVHQVLQTKAAQGQLQYDDTGNRILETQGLGRAVHTTAFISLLGTHAIYLFYTSQHYAGENLELLLEQRTTEEPLLTMSDASSQNMPKHMDEALLARWILCFCLVHGRRKFFEITNFFTQECEFVLDIISQVYRYEKDCKKAKMTHVERLAYHQEHSAPLMEALRVWLNNQLLYQQAEENSSLGQAIRYMLRHWEPLTQFLRVAGAPIDNSMCEQAIKVAIRHRRNSLFYKTFKGAVVGDALMSIIHTAAQNKVNIFDYLNALQRHSAAVRASPELWLPWNYQEALATVGEQKVLLAA